MKAGRCGITKLCKQQNSRSRASVASTLRALKASRRPPSLTNIVSSLPSTTHSTCTLSIAHSSTKQPKLIHHVQTTFKTSSKWHQRQLRRYRSHSCAMFCARTSQRADFGIFRHLPPPARHQQARPQLRRRRLARRPPPRQATRRSAQRPGRRPTAPTSTRVRLIPRRNLDPNSSLPFSEVVRLHLWIQS